MSDAWSSALSCSTFDVALLSDGLQGRAAGQELLQLVSGLLVVGAVHAGGRLRGCRGIIIMIRRRRIRGCRG